VVGQVADAPAGARTRRRTINAEIAEIGETTDSSRSHRRRDKHITTTSHLIVHASPTRSTWSPPGCAEERLRGCTARATGTRARAAGALWFAHKTHLQYGQVRRRWARIGALTRCADEHQATTAVRDAGTRARVWSRARRRLSRRNPGSSPVHGRGGLRARRRAQCHGAGVRSMPERHRVESGGAQGAVAVARRDSAHGARART